MKLNELMDKDTSTMTDSELELHVQDAVTEAFKYLTKDMVKYKEICEAGRWGGDNQATGVRAGTMALYQKHIQQGKMEVRADEYMQMFTITPSRKNPINMGNRHSFSGAELANYINYKVPKMSDLRFTIEGTPEHELDAVTAKGRVFLDAYTVMIQQMGGGKYQREWHNSFASYFMKIDNGAMYENRLYNSRYGKDCEKIAYALQKRSYNAWTVPFSNQPHINSIACLKEFIISDLIKDTVFISLIDPDKKEVIVHITGNKTLLRDWLAGYQAKNHNRLREEFIDGTNNLVLTAMEDALNAEKLGKVI